MSSKLTIGIVGFGEAGFHLARGLRGSGVSAISAYDINTHTPRLGERIRQRARESEVELLGSLAQLATASQIVFSTVTANSAIEAAEQTAPFLAARHLYADLNSVSPATKRSIAQIVRPSGARFVEAAVMGPFPPHGHRVPMLLGGPAAAELVAALAPYGMRMTVISDQIGVAVAVKMCRSIVVKGMEALLFECALAATRYGADAQVFASLAESFPGMDWEKLAGYMMGRVIEHGERRAREMEEVAGTLRAAGVEPIMAEATARRQEWGAALGLLEKFDGKLPEDYRDVVKVIDDRKD
jgi:3-hydroxyisobutyrate dehydrogenase-like beta-hydroxyacid dehydrogenase